MKLFGTSGIRRRYDADLLRLTLDVGLAVGSRYRRVAVGRDTRTSGAVLKNALLAGLTAGGARCYYTGIVPTPTLAYSTRELDAGVMITASHNPPEYNGIKLFRPDGSAFDPEEEGLIEKIIEEQSISAVSWDKIQSVSLNSEAIERHIEAIRRRLPDKVKVKVVVDCGCAAASVITPLLLERMGCEVIRLNCNPSGFFPHDIEPVEANLQELIKTVKEQQADIGIAHDGDADRMMAVDDKGRFISGDKLLAIFAVNLKAKKVVTTIDASMAIEKMGFEVIRTRVGDPAVSVELRKGGDFGGEPAGSWMFPQFSLCPDGILAAAQAVTIAARQKLSALADSIPSYPIIRGSINTNGVDMNDLKQRLADLKPLALNETDGFRLSFRDGWLLIRLSGTEPKMRVTAEAKDEPGTRWLYDMGMGIIKNAIK